MELTLFSVFFFLLNIFLHSSRAFNDQKCETDYYWRDWNGKIPEDAFQAGIDRNGDSIYVAQAYALTELIPGIIYTNKSKAVVLARGNVIETDSFVKILCSENNSKFKWIPTESKDLHLTLTGSLVLIGGVDSGGEILYAGKVFDGKQTILGKVFKHSSQYKGLWVPNNGKQVNYLSYQILTYSCE